MTSNKYVFNLKPTGRRKRGKPKPTWKLEIPVSMGKRGMAEEVG